MAGDTRIVVASFNQVRALKLVLDGVLRLEGRPEALFVADDGSEPDSETLVGEFSAAAPFPVHFVTQENRGFRKAGALNNALRRIGSGRVLFLDGDTIPHAGWLREHDAALDAGADYATGGYVYLDVAQAEELEQAGGGAERFLTEAEGRRLGRVHRKQLWHRLVRTADKPKILGGNFSATMAALTRVNGFDEAFVDSGKEDSDIRNRLNAAGCDGRSLWSRAFVFHCPHELDPRRLDPHEARGVSNRAYYDSRKGSTRCVHGLIHDRSAT